MRAWLIALTENAIVLIDTVALLVVVYATIEAVVGVIRSWPAASAQDGREVWLRYARWLVAALTFQLAADIIETSITTSWEAVARIAAVAVIRTFLDYFLGRDVQEVRLRRSEAESAKADA